MQLQQTPLLLPISARPSRRSHSQPTYKIRSQNRIKINIKRLPNDFFRPSMPTINPLDLTSQQRSATQTVRRSPKVLDSKNYLTLEKTGTGVSFRAKSDHEQKRKRVVSQNTIEEEKTMQNQNILNWTFSRQMFEEKSKKVKSQVPVPCSPLRRSPVKVIEKQLGDNVRSFQNHEKVKSILSEKISELNLNRLKLNVRKNNHPQSYLQYIKRAYP